MWPYLELNVKLDSLWVYFYYRNTKKKYTTCSIIIHQLSFVNCQCFFKCGEKRQCAMTIRRHEYKNKAISIFFSVYNHFYLTLMMEKKTQKNVQMCHLNCDLWLVDFHFKNFCKRTQFPKQTLLDLLLFATSCPLCTHSHVNECDSWLKLNECGCKFNNLALQKELSKKLILYNKLINLKWIIPWMAFGSNQEIKLHFLWTYFQGQSKFIHYYQDPNLSNLMAEFMAN